MARLPRLTVVNQVHWLQWRGNNGQAVFVDDHDRALWLQRLAVACREHGVDVHAYVLLPTTVSVLLTPRRPDTLSRCIQALGRSYVRQFNARHGRTGTLWEGRYRCTVIESPACVMPAMACLDWEPVRAALVQSPSAYLWSSHAHYVGLRHTAWLTVPAAVWALGNTPFAREQVYAEQVVVGVSEVERAQWLDAVGQGWAVGSDSFLQYLTDQTGRRVHKLRPGRPAKPLELDIDSVPN